MEQLELEDCTWEGHMFYLELKQQCLCFIILREQIVVLLRAQEFYVEEICDFEIELSFLGVVIILREQIVVDCLKPSSYLANLSCEAKLQTTSHKFPKHLKSCIRNEKWLRTRLGDYKSPGDCILYGPEWESISPIAILPFIDDGENCYANAIHTNKEELKKLKVVDLKNGVTFVAKGLYIWKMYLHCWTASRCYPRMIYSYSDFSTICRIYNFLRESNWKLECDDVRRIWVPQGSNNGEWFKPEECWMIIVRFGRFGKNQNGKLLTLSVGRFGAVLENSGSHTREKITETRQVTELWCWVKYELSVENQKLKQVHPSYFIDKELARLTLGFFSDPSFEMEPKERHKVVVQCLLNLSILHSLEPINVKYSISGFAGKITDVEASQMIRWEMASSKLFTQKIDTTMHKSTIECATYFSEAIAKGLLWEKKDRLSVLSELLKLGFFVKFDKEAVGFLMKSKNLQVFKDGEDFMSASFPFE
ncbi:hypothetical protein ACFE04_012282 [Oxalis oulophora]